MRSVLVALSVPLSLLGACAGPDVEPVNGAPSALERVADSGDEVVLPRLEPGPQNPCEDLCYEIYLAQSARCLLLPKSQRQACYAKAAQDLGACLKNCRERGEFVGVPGNTPGAPWDDEGVSAD